jgi:penicillin-binding protein 1C
MRRLEKILIITCICIGIGTILLFIFCLPKPLFNDPYSIVVLDKDDELVGVRISEDGQWRFPEAGNINDKFKTCITVYEDKRFYKHPGVDIFAIARAIKKNINNNRIVSGGSTITMQTIRLVRKDKPRVFSEKIIEIFMALRLELGYSKDEILRLYASHAPFGGNVVGLDAAAWRYFGRSPDQLTWAENAMLAVLPNSPSMIHTARNRDKLKEKRDNLLHRLYNGKYISKLELELSLDEEIPVHPTPYPMHAYHLVNRAAKENSKSTHKIKTTIDIKLQKQVNDVINRYNQQYLQSDINNIACLVLEVETGNAVVYVGNGDFNSDIPEKAIDMISANRSTGSILKPFLYSASLSGGEILPKTLLKDIPTKMGAFSPENFDKNYDGAIHADEALARSLNIPFVYMLRDYGILKFIYVLNSLGLKSINKSAEHYGLSLILGGAESSLWDVCGAYVSLARSLKNFNKHNSRYNHNDYHSANYIHTEKHKSEKLKKTGLLSAASIWFTFEAMTSINRPGDEKQWKSFSSKQKISWKTGTSFGFKDAWSIGITPDYVVGVWVGNASGEGKPDIVGLKVAAPVLFEVFNILPNYKQWFETPYDELVMTSVCRKSGCLAGKNCEDTDSVWIPSIGFNTQVCPYHQIINLDQTETMRVNSNCYETDNMKKKSWFILPPTMEFYYKSKNIWYKTLPPIMTGCEDYSRDKSKEVMELIYPNQLSRVYIPVDLQGDTLSAVFKVVHRNEDAIIYWHVDDKYITSTTDYHEIGLKLPAGLYMLHLVDNKGNKLLRRFQVVSKL